MRKAKFRIPEKDKVSERIKGIPAIGYEIRPRKTYACRVCGRAISPLGRLPAAGFPTCASEACEVTPMSALTRLLATPYGCAVHIEILSVFTKVHDTGKKVMLSRSPILERADVLANAYVELLKWQEAFDTYERMSSPSTYEEGALQHIPPRRIDEIVALRAVEQPVLMDPVRRIQDEKTRRRIRRIYLKGPEGFKIPF